jgi:hypothetical protein
MTTGWNYKIDDYGYMHITNAGRSMHRLFVRGPATDELECLFERLCLTSMVPQFRWCYA